MSDTKKAGSVAVSNNKAMIFLKENLGIIIALLILCVFLSVFPGTSESFPTVRNVFNVLRQISSNLLLACGMTMVIILILITGTETTSPLPYDDLHSGCTATKSFLFM